MHTHILLFGSKFRIILAIYVQMLDMYIKKIEYIEKIGYFRKYHYRYLQTLEVMNKRFLEN